MPHNFELAQVVSGQRHRQDPADASEDVEGEEAKIAHASHARHERREGAHDRNEFGVDQRLAAMLLIERLRPPDIFLLEKSRVLFRENLGTGAMSQEVTALVAQDRKEREDGKKQEQSKNDREPQGA